MRMRVGTEPLHAAGMTRHRTVCNNKAGCVMTCVCRKVYQQEKAKLTASRRTSMTSSLEPRASYRQVGAKTKVPSPLGLSSSKAVSLVCCLS